MSSFVPQYNYRVNKKWVSVAIEKKTPRFATEEEAAAFAANFILGRSAFKTHVYQSEAPVNARWENDALVWLTPNNP